MKEKILVSACLLGVNCRYNGETKENNEVFEYLKDKEVMLICPEIMGGLPTPRMAAQRRGYKVVTKDGRDVTENFQRGANEVLKLAKKFNIKKALLKAKSPSCGSGLIYDGTFSGNKIPGDGITAELLKKNGIEIITEEDIKN